VDHLACILPFEEPYFRERGVKATFVGHPLISQLQAETPDADQVNAFKPLGSPVIACLPGSRDHVIGEVLPGQIEVARAIAAQHDNALFLFAAAHDAAAARLKEALRDEAFTYRIEVNSNAEILSVAELALVASGTATLEVAYHRVPMVIMYNGSKWGYQLVARWLIQTPHLSLPNILAGREIVPEFMPYFTSTEPIAAEALDILANDVRRQKMRDNLNAIINSLGTDGAAANTASIAIDMMR
jgi:lipid-A-disaccharide synthase